MIKKILLSIIAIILIGGAILYSVNGKDNYDKTKFFAKATNGLSIGSELDLKLPDQFDKEQQLQNNTKILIFAFSKNTGHIIRQFISTKNKNFLENQKALFVADISKMPVFIRNTFALPDLRKSPYKILLIYDRAIATTFEKGIDKDKVIILELKNKQIMTIKYANSISELDKILK